MHRCEDNSRLVVLKRRDGVALVTLVTLIVLFGFLAVAVGTLLNQNSASTVVEISSLRALYLAEAGLNDSFWELKYGSKLYGQMSIPPGRIEPRDISFPDGSSGSYHVPEPVTEIVATGLSGGVTRRVRVAIISNTLDFALYSEDSRDVTFKRDVEVTGDVFINGNLTVDTPTDIDTNSVTVHLEEGNEAHYSNGSIFPYVTMSAPPNPPSLNTAWYDSLLIEASSLPYSDEFWGNHTVQDTTLINGSLIVANKATIGRSGGPAVVVVTGAVLLGNKVNVEDSISFIAGSGIAMVNRVVIGETIGASGNICFTKSGIIAVALQCVVNGSVISNGDVSVMRTSEVNGLVYAVNSYQQIIRGGVVRGALWVGRFSSDDLIRRSKIIYSPQYLPSVMPPGVTPPAGTVSIARAANSWREVR